MKQSQKATLAVIIGFSGFIVTETISIISDLPVDSDTDKVESITQTTQAKRTISTPAKIASHILKRQTHLQLGLARQVNLAPC